MSEKAPTLQNRKAHHDYFILESQEAGIALAGCAFTPGCRHLHLPAWMLSQGRFQKTRLSIVDPVALRMLLWGAIQQHFLQFFNGTGVDDRHFTAL